MQPMVTDSRVSGVEEVRSGAAWAVPEDLERCRQNHASQASRPHRRRSSTILSTAHRVLIGPKACWLEFMKRDLGWQPQLPLPDCRTSAITCHPSSRETRRDAARVRLVDLMLLAGTASQPGSSSAHREPSTPQVLHRGVRRR